MILHGQVFAQQFLSVIFENLTILILEVASSLQDILLIIVEVPYHLEAPAQRPEKPVKCFLFFDRFSEFISPRPICLENEIIKPLAFILIALFEICRVQSEVGIALDCWVQCALVILIEVLLVLAVRHLPATSRKNFDLF